MATQKKKSTAVVKSNSAKKPVAKKSAPAKKVVAKKTATTKKVLPKAKASKPVAKKAVPAKKVAAPKKATKVVKAAPAKKVAAKKSASAKKIVAKKPAAPKKMVKEVKAKKSASKLSPSTPSKKNIVTTQKPTKKTAKVGGSNKAVTKKVAIKKKETAKKTSASTKKVVAKKVTARVKKSTAKPVAPKATPKKAVAPKKETKVTAKKVVAKTIDKTIPKAKAAQPKKAPKAFVVPKTHTDKARRYEPNFVKSVLDQTPEEPQGPTLRYSDNDLMEFRELISKKLETAKKELGYLHGLITRKDQLGGDDSENRYMTMEDGGLSMEREQLGQMASRQITFIDHLEKALMRIENKTYGICRVTGKLIDKARLRAVPHATLSIEAKIGRAHSNI